MTLTTCIRNLFGLQEKLESTLESEINLIEKIDSSNAINPFSIVPWMYEEELDKKYGINLSNLENGVKSGFKGDLRTNIFFKGDSPRSVRKIDKKILKKFKLTPSFCSMIVKNKGELDEHIKNIHELSYNHYVFGKENEEDFPFYCCGWASRNILLTLMEKGYPNATFFYNAKNDHAYVGLPFLFGEDAEKGFIIVDPTSDQLFKNRKSPKNNLFVASGDKWDYETNWRGGADLYPSEKDYSKFSNLYTLRNHPTSSIYECNKINRYFKNIFKNPVEVKIEPI